MVRLLQFPHPAEAIEGLEIRQQAAESLAWWAHRKLAAPPDLIGHSYGGSLSMMTTQSEKVVRGLVLLSPAVHRTCLPDPANYEQILHVTTRLDLVLLADLSTPSFARALPRVTERRIKRRGLTGHSTTHDPRAWRESGLTDFIRNDWLPTLSPRSSVAGLPTQLTVDSVLSPTRMIFRDQDLHHSRNARGRERRSCGSLVTEARLSWIPIERASLQEPRLQ